MLVIIAPNIEKTKQNDHPNDLADYKGGASALPQFNVSKRLKKKRNITLKYYKLIFY